MSDEFVLLDYQGTTAWVRLNRPEQMNAMSDGLIAGLETALDRIDADDRARVVVITGSGRAFSAGGDLKGFREKITAGEQRAFALSLHRSRTIFKRLEETSRPVMAAVNGVAVAGGLELILCCDIVIAAESAKIGDGHLKFGVIPGSGSSVRLPRKLPLNIANRLLLTGELVPAAQMAAWGLVNEVVPDDKLVETVSALAERIGKLSPLGLAWIKQLIATGLSQPLDQALKSEIAGFEAYSHSADFLEGLTAFSEKREPNFKGV